MSPLIEAFLRSWPLSPWLLLSLGLSASIYLRGWLVLHRRHPQRWHVGQLVAFIGGLAIIFLALGSPIEPFAALLFRVHMLQHLLLMMAAPPLIWLGEPLFPMLCGLPRPVRTYWVAPLYRSHTLQRVFARLTHPAVALPLFVAATWLWHLPLAYELALQSDGWHYVQHVCFLSTGLLFWFPVVRPYPSHPRWSPWLLLPYLIVADVQNTVLSALLTFSGKVLYPHYASLPRLGGISALDDQSAAGVLMWVPGSVAFLIPLFSIGIGLLYGQEHWANAEGGRNGNKSSGSSGRRPVARDGAARVVELPVIYSVATLGIRSRTERFNLLHFPLVGRFLRWRHARLALQLPMLTLAAVVMVDGLRGPQIGAMNLAGVLPWIHWRGLLILTLLVAGNFFCMACPFTVPRSLGVG